MYSLGFFSKDTLKQNKNPTPYATGGDLGRIYPEGEDDLLSPALPCLDIELEQHHYLWDFLKSFLSENHHAAAVPPQPTTLSRLGLS